MVDPEIVWGYLRRLGAPPVAFLSRPVVYGLERVPREGGFVLAVNHLSAIDPPLVGGACPRAVYFMAKKELLDLPIVGAALKAMGSFPVRRGEGDREALRRARELVRAGRVVGIFAEGTRQRLGYPGPLHTGAVMIAMQEGVPVVPCGLESFGWSLANRRPCVVVWGDPLELRDLPPGGRGFKRGTQLVEQAILALWRQAAEAAAAGFPAALHDGSRRRGFVTPREHVRARS